MADALRDVLRKFLAAGNSLSTGSIHLPGMQQPCMLKVSRSHTHWVHEISLLTRLADVDAVPNLLLPAALDTPKLVYNVLLVEHAGDALTQEQWCDCQVVKQVLGSLAAVHAAGVVHGDLKPEHVCMKQGMVKIVDWDAAALRTSDHGALLHPALAIKDEQRDMYLTQVPNHLFWGSFMGTGRYASWHQHFGYGPSVMGDVESVGYVVMDQLSNMQLPWRAMASSRAIGDAKWQLLHAMSSRNQAPNGITHASWLGWWELLQAQTGALRTDKEAGAAASLATFVLEKLLDCEGPHIWPECEALNSDLQPPPPMWQKTQQDKGQPQTQGPQTQGPGYYSPLGNQAHFRSVVKSLGDKAESLGRDLLGTHLGVQLRKAEGSTWDTAFRSLRSMQQAKEGLCANVEVDFVAEMPGTKLHQLLTKSGDQRSVHMTEINAAAEPKYAAWQDFHAAPTVKFAAEFVMSSQTSYIRKKLSQLEAGLFFLGMRDPGKAMEPPLVGAVVYVGHDDMPFKMADHMLVQLPRCRALAIAGRLFAIRMNDPQLLELLSQVRIETASRMASLTESRMDAVELQMQQDKEEMELRLQDVQKAMQLEMQKEKAAMELRLQDMQKAMQLEMQRAMAKLAPAAPPPFHASGEVKGSDEGSG